MNNREIMATKSESLGIKLDFQRGSRQGFEEAILCGEKSTEQLTHIIDLARAKQHPFLITRLSQPQFLELPDSIKDPLDYDPVSRTAYLGPPKPTNHQPKVALVSAGSSDLPVAKEVSRTLAFNGYSALEINDVGVAGIWRLMERVEEIAAMPVVIAVAGMDAALASVLGGLVRGSVIGVPTSTGYGVSDKGKTALNAMLASCAPGVTVVNIDNGYGAALAAIRTLQLMGKETQELRH